MNHTFFGFLLLLLLTACQPVGTAVQSEQKPAYSTPVGVTLPPPTPRMISNCPTPKEAEGATLRTEAISASQARVVLTGLQPGEALELIFTTGTEFNGTEVTEAPIQRADAEGRYTYEVGNLRDDSASEGEPAMWRVRVLHSGGIVCGNVTLPTE